MTASSAMEEQRSLLPSMALQIGMTLGAVEALWVVATRPVTPLSAATLVILYGCLGYGCLSVVIAMAASLLVQRRVPPSMPRRQGTPSVQAAAVAVAATLAVHFTAAWVRGARADELWLIPGCLLSAAAIGWLVARLVARHEPLQRPALWLIGSLTALALAALLAQLRVSPSWPALGTGIGLLAAALAVATWIGRRSGARVLAHAPVLLAIACLPLVVTGVDRIVPAPAPRGGGPPNILLISVDTLRTDRLGCYGATAVRTPHIDALAAQGVVFEQTASAIALTGPSHTTMLTGLYHHRHGAEENGVQVKPNVPTIADVLGERGYRTAAFVSGWTLKNAATGLGSRFAHYDEDFSPWAMLPDAALDLALPRLLAEMARHAGVRIEQVERLGAHTTTRVLDWLGRHRHEAVFVFAHYFDAHAPYAPPAPFDTMYDPDYPADGPAAVFSYTVKPAVWQRIISTPRDVEHFRALYSGEVSYVDAEIGRLLDGLTALGLSGDTIVVFTSDHGESFTEHEFYFDHGEFLYDTCVHVPLIIRFPDGRGAGTRQAAQVSLADLAPTILAAVGAAVPAHLDGRSLLPLADGSALSERAPAFGWVPPSHQEGAFRARYSVRSAGYKLIWNFDRRHRRREPVYEELYDLAHDPLERTNLAQSNVPMLDPLRAMLQAWRDTQGGVASESAAPSAEVQERLRALGY